MLPLDVGSASLLDAVVLLGNFRVKRIPLVSGPTGDIVNIITQSSIVHHVSTTSDIYGFVTHKTLKEAGLAEKSVVQFIGIDQPVKAAFNLIKNQVHIILTSACPSIFTPSFLILTLRPF